MTRTHDLLITNQLLYRLSYTSACYEEPAPCQILFLVYHRFADLKRDTLRTTRDLLITNQLLYRLSYTSIV